MFYVEDWILAESPAFAAAYEAWYSHRVKNIAPFATTFLKMWRAAEQYEGTTSIVLTKRAECRARLGQAIAQGDVNFLLQCGNGLQYLLDTETGKTDDSDYLTPERFVIEGYRWLRLRSGEGSPRPSRLEVLTEARRIWVYHRFSKNHPKTPRVSYPDFVVCLSSDRVFLEQAERELADAERFFPAKHADRLFSRVGLGDLKAKTGRPNKKIRCVTRAKLVPRAARKPDKK
jgi:hypothetical protein